MHVFDTTSDQRETGYFVIKHDLNTTERPFVALLDDNAEWVFPGGFKVEVTNEHTLTVVVNKTTYKLGDDGIAADVPVDFSPIKKIGLIY